MVFNFRFPVTEAINFKPGKEKAVSVLLKKSYRTYSLNMENEQIEKIINGQRSFFDGGKTKSYHFRKQQLVNLKSAIKKNESEIIGALASVVGQEKLPFDLDKENELIDIFFLGIEDFILIGPELLVGKIFNKIGFNKISDELNLISALLFLSCALGHPTKI